ncbi:FBD-like protein [Artemisia annua]|uniref:FBD-like protein n=1 Tax=Artemisia annua TaxID=35608 RepID=A0A2U1P0H9_ARTAN|nr:FBD-like protein [Artemisia annua]
MGLCVDNNVANTHCIHSLVFSCSYESQDNDTDTSMSQQSIRNNSEKFAIIHVSCKEPNMRCARCLAQNKQVGDQHDYNPDDFLSRMPDDILVSILSLLPLKDAGVTSLLSRSWRYMWCRSVRLDFEDYERMLKIVAQPSLRNQKRNRYIRWINRVMLHHKSGILEEFKICYDLDKHYKGALTKWIEFAMSKKVQKLELNLMENDETFSDSVRNFVFPHKVMDTKPRSLKRKSLNVPQMPSAKMTEINLLKSLIFKCVNVSDEAIGKILTRCRVLEHLYICNSGHTVNVKISGPNLALTKLEIIFCNKLESIEICETNLACFQYLGIENNLFQQISSCIPYLHVLELRIFRPKPYMNLLSFPELPNVKKLSMIVGAWYDDSLLGLTWLVKACPNLQKFEIQLIWRTPVVTSRLIRHEVTHIHRHLEEVQIGGYYGRISDLELALYFYENSVALKKIVVDPTKQVNKRNSNAGEVFRRESSARISAHIQLKHRISRGVVLEIL